MGAIDKGFLWFPSNLNSSYFPWKTSRFPTSLPNPAFPLNPLHNLSPLCMALFSKFLSLSSSISRIICPFPLPPPLIWPCNLSGEFNLWKILWEIVKLTVIISYRLNDHWSVLTFPVFRLYEHFTSVITLTRGVYSPPVQYSHFCCGVRNRRACFIDCTR